MGKYSCPCLVREGTGRSTSPCQPNASEMAKKMKLAKPYWEMNAAELAEATKEFDLPIPESKLRPLTRRERMEFERLQKAPGRSIFLKRKRAQR